MAGNPRSRSLPQVSDSPAPRGNASPTVLVTGGSRGIGRAICLAFGHAGWRVGVHYRVRREEAERTIAMVKDLGGDGRGFQADIREAQKVQAMVEEYVAHWGGLDVMVCNAGQASDGLLLRLHPEQWAATIDTNLTGTFHCLQAAGNVMIRQHRGSLVVVSSFAATRGQAGQTAYAASKAGLLGLVKTAAKEWGQHNVRVNAVLPGWHRTDLSAQAIPPADGLHDHVLGRTCDLGAVARAIYHLALLEDASGQAWNLDSRIM